MNYLSSNIFQVPTLVLVQQLAEFFIVCRGARRRSLLLPLFCVYWWCHVVLLLLLLLLLRLRHRGVVCVGVHRLHGHCTLGNIGSGLGRIAKILLDAFERHVQERILGADLLGRLYEGGLEGLATEGGIVLWLLGVLVQTRLLVLLLVLLRLQLVERVHTGRRSARKGAIAAGRERGV